MLYCISVKICTQILFRILSSVEVYDESCDAWKECESLPYPILGAAAFSLENSIHIFGGITYEGNDEIISSNSAIFNAEENRYVFYTSHYNSIFKICKLH